MVKAIMLKKYNECHLLYLWMEKKGWVKPRNIFEVTKQYVEETKLN